MKELFRASACGRTLWWSLSQRLESMCCILRGIAMGSENLLFKGKYEKHVCLVYKMIYF